MKQDVVSLEVLYILTELIQSVGEVEILLYLFENRPKDFSLVELSSVIRASPTSVETRLRVLESAGLVSRKAETQTFLFSPKQAKLDTAVSELARAWQLYRHRVIEMIFSKQTNRAILLASSFQLKKE